VSTQLTSVKDHLNEKNQELQQLSQDKNEIETLKSNLESTREQLEKDRKSLKELQNQNVKLKSLVKIGEDSLKAEMKRSDELSNLLKLRNGSAVSTPCLTSNGSSPNVASPSLLTTVSSTHSLSPVDQNKSNGA